MSSDKNEYELCYCTDKQFSPFFDVILTVHRR